MRTAIFDLETTSLAANTGILLCCVIKEYGTNAKPTIIRADSFPQWETRRSYTKPIVRKVVRELSEYDILVAHNGQRFDRPMLVSWALKFDLPVLLRFMKFFDPVLLARRHLRLARNSLQELIRFLDVPEDKTPVSFDHWLRAALDGNRHSMDYIVRHCVQDVLALNCVYEKVKHLSRSIDDRGSSF